MKRVDEGRLIKIPDSNAVAAAVAGGQMGSRSSPLASITPIFTSRPPLHHGPIMSTQDHSNQVSRAGVTIYRGENVTTTSSPVTTSPQTLNSIHQNMMQTIKQEPIGLPSAPINIQYVSTFPTGLSNNVPSVVMKTSSSNLMPNINNIQLQSQSVPIHARSPLHQNSNFSSPTVMRTLSNTPPQPSGVAVPNRPPSNSGNLGASSTSSSGRDASNSGLSPNPSSASFQRLKVEDALSYLDQVKFKFGNQPQVYNDFLDIMKEFKSQSIDTPGVIARVSSLFRGHPELIVGFNTFLPPGYKIEIHSPDSIAVSIPGIAGPTVQTIVHTPQGILRSHIGGAQLTSNQANHSNTNNTRPASGIPTPLQPQHGFKLSENVAAKSPNYSSGVTNNVSQLVSSHLSSAAKVTLPQSSPSSHPLHVDSNVPESNTTQRVPSGASQPVEFNHAITYVNKIKTRFQHQPDVYKQFLEILHTYQKDQKAIKEGRKPTGPFLTEAEVYGQVAKLFESEEDLLDEFGQFLPEATGESTVQTKGLTTDYIPHSKSGDKAGPKYDSNLPCSRTQVSDVGIKRVASASLSHPPSGKRPKSGFLRDISIAEASKFGTLNEFAFFDKVRRALKSPEIYDNFLRCLVLFNQEVISRGELIQLTTPFLSRHPDLFKWFKDFVGDRTSTQNSSNSATVSKTLSEPDPPHSNRHSQAFQVETTKRIEASRGVGRDRTSDSALEIDYSACKRLGASYCALPKNFVQPSCSGRTLLCKEVLNDTWVSFPSWSEDSQFVTSRKTQYEETVYRTEDERFEFDVVLETNKDTIKVLECVQKKMSRMPPEEAARYHLDDCLGGTSHTIHQRSIRRIYGDKANDIMAGLKRNPVVAVPLVLRRLKSKDEEWRQSQKSFNKIWRDQNDKYYLKSLDHQGMLFKQSDVRSLRSKSLLNEIESLYDERREQNELNENSNSIIEGPHLTLNYSDQAILEDANNLLIHHVKRQTSIHKEEKQKIKVLLKHFLMDCFNHPHQELSDDETEANLSKEDEEADSESGEKQAAKNSKLDRHTRLQKDDEGVCDKIANADTSDADQTKEKSCDNNQTKEETPSIIINDLDIKVDPKDGRKTPLHSRDMDPDESYTLFMANNNWYLFLRLHQILCERLSKMNDEASIIAAEDQRSKKDRKESIAEALRLKSKSEIDPDDYYPTFLDMVKNFLDGNLDSQSYEDTLREMFGIHAYVSFTLDKVINNAVRQLQHLVSDDSCVECLQLFQSESKSKGTGGLCGTAAERQIPEFLYQKKAEKLLVDENCIKFLMYHKKGRMTIELFDTEMEDQDSDEESSTKHQKYIDRFIGPDDELSKESRQHLVEYPIFLPRSVRSYNSDRAVTNRKVILEDEIKKSKSRDLLAAQNLMNMHQNPTENERLKDDESDEDAKKSQCTFDLKNYGILHIFNNGQSFYRSWCLKRALTSHKSVSQRKFSSFERWHAAWARKNVSEEQHKSTENWFMGNSDDLVANQTQKRTRTFTNKEPFRIYHKWIVEVIPASEIMN